MIRAIDELQRKQDERTAWVGKAAEQIKRWREEDARNGQPWSSK